MVSALPPPLVALTPGDLDTVTALRFPGQVARAVESGLRGVLLREHALSDAAFLELARELRAILGARPGNGDHRGGWLGVHDRAHLVAAAEADALHVGHLSLSPAEARRVVGDAVALGLSTHAPDDPASWVDADYLIHGPVKATPSKAGLLEPIGAAGLSAAVIAADGRPVLGIGGLVPGDAALVLGTGAAGLAVLSGVFGKRDPAAGARAYLEDLHRTRGGDGT
jgi:thiamine-phosphate diphosphorylase